MKGKKLAEFQAWAVVYRPDEAEPTSMNGGIGFYDSRAEAREIARDLGQTTVRRVTVQIIEHKRAK